MTINNPIAMNQSSKIYVAGHKGLAGSAIVRKLQDLGYTNIIVRTHKELDLTRQSEVEAFFEGEKPEFVFWPQLRSVEYWLTIRTRQNLYIRTL